jgi:amino acid adenylation domain-containing protein
VVAASGIRRSAGWIIEQFEGTFRPRVCAWWLIGELGQDRLNAVVAWAGQGHAVPEIRVTDVVGQDDAQCVRAAVTDASARLALNAPARVCVYRAGDGRHLLAMHEPACGKPDGDAWAPVMAPIVWPCRTDLSGNSVVESAGTVDSHIGPDITRQLAEFADRMGTTARTVALAALRALLSRHIRRAAILIGTPLETAAEVEQTSLSRPMSWRCVDVGSQSSFASLVRAEHVCATSSGPSVALPAASAAIAAAARLPVGQVAFRWRDGKECPALPGANAEPVTLPACPGPYELSVELQSDRRAGLVAGWHYVAEALDPNTVAELAARYVVLLGAALSEPEQPLNALSVLTPGDRERLAAAAEPYAVPYGHAVQDDGSAVWEGETVVDMIAGQVAAAPGTTALSASETSITYAELWARSGDVATELVRSGVRSEEPVGILLARGTDMVIALLGVLRAGACCLPLDPAQPPDRLGFLLANSCTRVLLTDDSVGEVPEAAGLTVRRIRDLPVTPDATRLRGVAGHSDGLAYLLYTSGSTGTPKGVGVTHAGLANCLHASRTILECRPGQRLLAISTVSFDIAAMELLLMLISGGETVVASAGEQRNGELLRSALARCRPDYLQATPISVRMLFVCGWEGDPDLTVMCGGDVVAPALAARLAACTRRLWHTYGPTEASLYTVTQILPAGLQPPIVPIGERLPGTYIRILDGRLSEVPPGDIGELCIGGAGVARGYLGLPGLTARRFVPDPVAVGARLYRTGDLARQRRDGRLELHGRADRQVKIRGHRIEPGEIEAVLGRHPDVAVAAIEIAGDTPDGRRIEAYVQPTEAAARRMVSDTDGGAELAASITAFGNTQLPAHMRPAIVRVLKSMPMNLRGKVDRQALHMPQAPNPRPARSSTDADELAVIATFSSVLGRPAETSDFPADSGDLALMAGVRDKLRDWYGADIGITELAAAASPRELALALRLNRIRRHLPADAATGCRWIRRGETLPALVLVGAEPLAESYRTLLGQIEETRPVALADASRVRPELAASALLAELGANVYRGIVFAGLGAGTDVALALAAAAERAAGRRYPVAVIGGPLPRAAISYRGQVFHITTRQSAGHPDTRRAHGHGVSVVMIPGDVGTVLGREEGARIAGLLAELA